MSAPTNAIVQVNLKDSNGALYNVYGHDEDSFRDGLSILKAYVAEIAEVQSLLTGASNVTQQMPVTAGPPAPAPVAPVQAPPVAAPTWGAPPPPAASFQQAAVPQCQHGPRTARSGNGAKGPWRAWMCPTPKGTPGQCEPDWVRRGTPEWDTFPA